MYKNLKYADKEFKIKAYNSSVEKEILVLDSMEINDLDQIFELFEFEGDISNLSDEEKIMLMYKHRAISVSDTMGVKYTCSFCGTNGDGQIDIDDIIIEGDIKNPKIKNAFKTFKESEIQDFLTVDIDDIDLNEYDELVNEIETSVLKFNFFRPCKCFRCGNNNYIDISKGNIIANLSDESISSIYNVYSEMVFGTNFTKSEIDNMYPFERSIFITMHNKLKEDN